MGGQGSDGNGDQGSDVIYYVLQEAKIVMQRWPDNLHVLGQSKQRWQTRNLELALN